MLFAKRTCTVGFAIRLGESAPHLARDPDGNRTRYFHRDRVATLPFVFKAIVGLIDAPPYDGGPLVLRGLCRTRTDNLLDFTQTLFQLS